MLSFSVGGHFKAERNSLFKLRLRLFQGFFFYRNFLANYLAVKRKLEYSSESHQNLFLTNVRSIRFCAERLRFSSTTC